MKSPLTIRLARLVVLGSGAALLSACGASSSPVNSAEVPAASEAKPSAPDGPPGESKSSGDAAGAVSTAKPGAGAAPAPAPSSPAKPRP